MSARRPSLLHALRALATEDDALAALLTEGAALQVESRLRLLELAEQDAPQLATAAQSAPEPAVERPGRQRAAGE